ncbi:DUF6624 domain-containing protein [Nguyenibacter vanlangensis]|uniref:DUF6624 domain-containing protein n=1 Tax=Nguyenibacter vanlangensis TaxID=1216886 RepID=A0ABZ3D8B2_9PROT
MSFRDVSSYILIFYLLYPKLCYSSEINPPPILKKYIKNSHFNPNHYQWARGAFADATAEEKQQWGEIKKYLNDCQVQDKKNQENKLNDLKIEFSHLVLAPYQNGICRSVLFFVKNVNLFRSYSDLSKVLTVADDQLNAILFAVKEMHNRQKTITLQDDDLIKLLAEEDQVDRDTYIEYGMKNKFDNDVQKIVTNTLGNYLSEEDSERISQFEHIIEKKGWKYFTTSPRDVNQAAFLIIQHVTSDMAFQVSASNHILTWYQNNKLTGQQYTEFKDRIDLYLHGKQTFGTQFQCISGKWVPFPIKTPSNVDHERKRFGLIRLRLYAESLKKAYGEKCEG